MNTDIEFAVLLAATLGFKCEAVGQSSLEDSGSYLLVADFNRDSVRRYAGAD